jgi:hypothetical protein
MFGDGAMTQGLSPSCSEKGAAHLVLRHGASEGDRDHVAVDCDDFACSFMVDEC